jgi:hypothetical protein
MQEDLQYIGKYRVLGIIGRGAMGVVYKAKDPEIDRVVAIKMIKSEILSSMPNPQTALERFQAEARSAGNLRHPHLVTIFEVNKLGDSPYMVMDFIEGEGLDQIIKRDKKIKLLQTIHYMNDVAQALDYAHSRGVIHRDIKPSNLLVDKADAVYICDFGVAFMAKSENRPGELVFGSPGYMSPEQILNEKLDPRADLFSFAVICFECLAGRRPFPGEDFTTVISNILSGNKASLSDFDPSFPKVLDQVFHRALSKNREDRYPSAHDLVQALRSALGVQVDAEKRRGKGEKIVPLSLDEALKRKARKRRFIGIGTLSFLIGLSALFSLQTEKQEAALPAPAQIATKPLQLIASAPETAERIKLTVAQRSEENLVSALRAEQDPFILVTALRALTERNRELPLDIALQLGRHPSTSVRRAMLSLHKLVAIPDRTQLLIHFLSDRDPRLRAEAASALLAEKSTQALPSLVDAARRESNPALRDHIQDVVQGLLKKEEVD